MLGAFNYIYEYINAKQRALSLIIPRSLNNCNIAFNRSSGGKIRVRGADIMLVIDYAVTRE